MEPISKEIYMKICEMILTPEFNDNQTQFFEKYKDSFSQEEENTHFSKEIHEEYIVSLEKFLQFYLELSYDEK